jgi:phosphatidyl-myo-inositol dimannoside synthase
MLVAVTERRTLIVTNDFPPRLGGIQSFVHSVAVRQPAGSVVVYASDHAGAQEFDAAQSFPVIRHPTGLLLPTPGARRRVLAAFGEHGCRAVWFGAAAPLALLAPDLRRAGAQRIVASTHGHEVGWALVPGGRHALRRIGAECDVVTFLTEYTRRRLAGALGPQATLRRLVPGVDAAQFHPGVDGSAVRARYGLAGRPVVACVSRLVPRKGQDVLIRALPIVQRQVPDAALLLVGRPNRSRFAASLRRRAQREGVSDDVVITGGVPASELVEHYAAGEVFAMPCRTRRFGLDVEGLGIVFLEASALARPVVAGASGGAPEAVVPGVTGYVVDGRDPARVADRLVRLLRDAAERDRMGRAGRSWVEQEWTWDATAARLYDLVQG